MNSESGYIFLVMSIVHTTLDIPKNPAERRGWVIWQLRLQGSSLSKIARAEGVSQQAVSNALIAPSSHLETAIAKALNLTPEQLFPERFNGVHRLSHTRQVQRNARASKHNVEDAEAA